MIPFLAHNHPVWRDNFEPIVRVKSQLKHLGMDINIIECPFHSGIPELLWPNVSVAQETQRYQKLLLITNNLIQQKPKVIIAHQRTITPELLRSQIPLIVVENTDAPTLEWSRYFLHLDNILAVIKQSVFRDIDHYSAEFCEGMYQGKLIWDATPSMRSQWQEPSLPYKIIDNKLLEKVVLGYSYGCYPMHKTLASMQIDYESPRKYDFSIMVNADYPRSKTVTAHRKKCLSVLKRLTGLNGFISERRVSQSEYVDVMLNTKVCISPLGLGVCHRSFEGINAGCVVLQPFSSYFKTDPDVYEENACYVSCKIDLSDMAEKIKHIVKYWGDYRLMRQQSKEIFLDTYWNHTSLAEQIYNYIQPIINKL